MFHAFVQRFDEIDEKFLGGELNRALMGNVAFSFYLKIIVQS